MFYVFLLQTDTIVEALMRYKPDPLKLDFNKGEKCAVEIADNRGPAFAKVAVKLFHQGCRDHQHDTEKMFNLLVQRKYLGDYTVSCIQLQIVL